MTNSGGKKGTSKIGGSKKETTKSAATLDLSVATLEELIEYREAITARIRDLIEHSTSDDDLVRIVTERLYGNISPGSRDITGLRFGQPHLPGFIDPIGTTCMDIESGIFKPQPGWTDPSPLVRVVSAVANGALYAVNLIIKGRNF